MVMNSQGVDTNPAEEELASVKIGSEAIRLRKAKRVTS
jgi:hypothetical protein